MSLMPQFGFFEFILIAALALIVAGKDLPRLMRTVGRAVAQARRMASEFTSAFEDMARESEMEEMRKEIEALKTANPIAEARAEIEDAVRPISDAVRDTRAAARAGEGGTATPDSDPVRS